MLSNRRRWTNFLTFAIKTSRLCVCSSPLPQNSLGIKCRMTATQKLATKLDGLAWSIKEGLAGSIKVLLEELGDANGTILLPAATVSWVLILADPVNWVEELKGSVIEGFKSNCFCLLAVNHPALIHDILGNSDQATPCNYSGHEEAASWKPIRRLSLLIYAVSLEYW